MKRIRLEADVRKQVILARAMTLAAKHGYTNITRQQIAEAAGVVEATVSHHFGTMVQFRRALMRAAVDDAGKTPAALKVVLQGLADKNTYAAKASDDLKAQAAAVLA
jgi:AcrR family transcriptional regulator